MCTGMDPEFTLAALHQLEEEYQTIFDSVVETAKCKSISDVANARGALTKPTKDSLAALIQNMTNVLSRSKNLLRSAAVTFDKLKNEQISNQNSMLKLQNELLDCKSEQLSAVETTVKSEIKSFSDIVQQNSNKTITPAKLKTAVESVVQKEDRSRNLMIFGLEEEEDGSGDLEDRITWLFGEINEKPRVKDCVRLRTGFESAGPVKVTLSNPESVRQILSKSKELRQVYITPDRSSEQRAERRKLVEEMKKRMKEQPERYFFIKKDIICDTARHTKLTVGNTKVTIVRDYSKG